VNDGDQDFFELPGTVLHLDGDPDYLDFCLSAYKQLGVTAAGVEVPEEQQPERVVDLIRKHSPDTLSTNRARCPPEGSPWYSRSGKLS